MTLDALQGRKIVIIGGAGFIGHHMALTLAARGADVEIIDSLHVNNLLWFTSNNMEIHDRELYLHIIQQRLALLNEKKIPVHIQDARDYAALSMLLTAIKPQVVVQLAAVSHAVRSNKDPHSTFDHSLRTLENALDALRGRVEHFIFFSSSMVYGNFHAEKVDEDQPLNPIGIYGALKLAGEKIVIAYNQVYGLPYTIIRPSALYGPRCVSRRVGQTFIENAFRGLPLKIAGDGEERLDFTYIDDLIEGLCLTIQNPAAKSQIFNITYGASRSLKEMAEVIMQYFPEAKIEHVKRDELMPVRGTLCIDRATRLLGYVPSNPIEVGLPKYIESYKGLLSSK